jgi:staphylococcal nuclease domain-containing protein 1
VTERRQFGTISVGKREDIGETLISEGLALTQRHRDDDEKSERYDDLIAAESLAKEAKKGVHDEKEYKKGKINDLADPRKAKAYSGSLIRAKTLKAIVDFVFNGARFRLHIPSENCHITFSLNFIRCPQPSAITTSRTTKAAEPFGDESRRHARLTLLQRAVEISCTGVTPGGVITGTLWVGQGPQRRDYGVELVAAGLSTVDQKKIDYGEAPKNLIDAQLAAQNNKVGIWSIMTPETNEPVAKTAVKSKERVVTIRLSEIVSGNHFFFRIVGDATGPAIDQSMKIFTKTNGLKAAQCDVKPGKVVAALFDDGTGKAWYRAKILTRPDRGHVQVLFIDHGNTSTVSVATQLRPLDMSLGVDRVLPVAKEAQLALTVTRSLKEDEGLEAAEKLQALAWGRDLTAILHCEMDGKFLVTLLDGDVKINEVLVSHGLARLAKQADVVAMQNKMIDPNLALELAAELQSSLEIARKSRIGMWRYGDIGDDDDDE